MRWFTIGCAATPKEPVTEVALAIVEVDVDVSVKRSLPVSHRTIVNLTRLPVNLVEVAQRVSQVCDAMLHRSAPLRYPVVSVQAGGPLAQMLRRYSYVRLVDVSAVPQQKNGEAVAEDDLVGLVLDEQIKLADGLDLVLANAMIDGIDTAPIAPLTVAAGLAIRASLEYSPERLPVGALARNA